MHHPENGTAMQTVLEVNLVAMSIKLFIVLSLSERAKNLKMERHQLIQNWMSNAKKLSCAEGPICRYSGASLEAQSCSLRKHYVRQYQFLLRNDVVTHQICQADDSRHGRCPRYGLP